MLSAQLMKVILAAIPLASAASIPKGAGHGLSGLSESPAHDARIKTTSPITLTTDKGPIKAYNRGLFVNPNAQTGSICPLKGNSTYNPCAPYSSDETWVEIDYKPVDPATIPFLASTSSGPSLYNGTLALDTRVSQGLFSNRSTGAIEYYGPHGWSPYGPDAGEPVKASLGGGNSMFFGNEAGSGKYPGFWWLCPTHVEGEYALSIKDTGDCEAAHIQYRYAYAGEVTGAFQYS